MLIGKVDTELLKTVVAKVLKAKYIQDANGITLRIEKVTQILQYNS